MTGANGHGVRLVVESHNVRTALAQISQLAEQQKMGILDAISFRDRKNEAKVFSACHFHHRPSESFLAQLRERGFRIVKLA